MFGRLSGGHVEDGVEAEKPKRRNSIMKLSQFRREFGGLELYTLLVEDLEDVAQSNCE